MTDRRTEKVSPSWFHFTILVWEFFYFKRKDFGKGFFLCKREQRQPTDKTKMPFPQTMTLLYDQN